METRFLMRAYFCRNCNLTMRARKQPMRCPLCGYVDPSLKHSDPAHEMRGSRGRG